jgi:ParB family chromosome partitioning protein
MSEKRRALGRGLGALIPNSPAGEGAARPVDVFFKDNSLGQQARSALGTVDAPAGGVAPAQVQRPAVSDHSRDHASDHASDPEHQGPAHEGAEHAGETGHGAAGAVVDGQGADGASLPEQDGDTGLAPVPGASFAEVPVDVIRPNPKQPRSVFDADDMGELVHSIREIGVLQPIVVRPVPVAEQNGDGARYELIMGERRWRATQEAGLLTVPAIIKDTDDDDLLRDALLENLHRSQLNALEEAAAYAQLLEDFGCTHDELAGRIGRSRPQISNTLRLLKLPPLVARRVAAGVLSAGHARALLALEDGAAMERLAQRIVAEGLSVRSVEEIVSLGGDQEPARPRRPRAGGRHPQLDDLAARLSDRFDTRVNIALGQRKGKLTVEFASVDDLHRIVDLLGVSARD